MPTEFEKRKPVHLRAKKGDIIPLPNSLREKESRASLNITPTVCGHWFVCDVIY